MGTGLEGKYIIKDNKKLRFGYTTGSCAAAAAQAACRMLFSGQTAASADLMTPKGICLHLEIEEPAIGEEEASCAVRKDAGDDPDVTDGLLIFVSVRRCSREEAESLAAAFGRASETTGEAAVGIAAGEGVGMVTLPGLEQPVGAPAVNRVSREMIASEVQAVCAEYGYTQGIRVTVSVPDGAEIAKKTFNPRLGIEGGISILGTSGIVEPMSEQALTASIELEMRQKSGGGKTVLLVTPGNYGQQYLRDNFPFSPQEAVKCSNFVGQTIDLAVNLELEGLLFVAHIGKFIKVAGGIMNTHSRDADARMEILASCALRAGASAETAREILGCVTTDEGLRVIRESGLWEETVNEIMKKIEFFLEHRSGGRLRTGAVVFSNAYGELGRTTHAEELIGRLLRENSADR